MLRFALLVTTIFLVQQLPVIGQTIVAPKPGIAIPAEVRSRLEARISKLKAMADAIRKKHQNDEAILRFLPDAEVFHIAVGRTLEDAIFFKKGEFEFAESQLDAGQQRLDQLADGKAPWNEQTGLVVRGYRSRLDDSVQPYQLWVPSQYESRKDARRLDIWYHGRNDRLNEVAFIGKSKSTPGSFKPDDAFVLAPYGRFCNAMKFAGEVDTWEALDHAKQFYAIDDQRVSVRGFSMGGAATWHLGAHHASKWAAVNPGAGFVETKIYQNLAAKLNDIPEYEQKLWRLYDALEYAVNLQNTTLVAYSGEIDKQKAAADLMEGALLDEGLKMTHIIGPNTGHKYEPKARETVARLVDAAVTKGRVTPNKIRFVTFTMKFNEMHWVTIDGLEKHWEPARVEAERNAQGVHATTSNVSAITFSFPAKASRETVVSLDGQKLETPAALASEASSVSFIKVDGKWRLGKLKGIRKAHNLQGPIDDAFMDSFVFVEPSGAGWNATTDQWVRDELADASFQWRRQMRGVARQKPASAISDDDIAKNNLILWGDPKSNPLIAKVLPQLPLKWTESEIEIAGEKFDSANSVPVLIFPNPLNPQRYVVLNSGQTFMHFGAQSNSMQTPKLPDYAVLNTAIGASKRINGHGVRKAGFFDEQWRLAE